jgi:hypothetical protein
MRQSLIAAGLVLVLVLGCSDDDDAGIDGEELLRRSEEAMLALSSVRVTLDVDPAAAGESNYQLEVLEFSGPRCVRSLSQPLPDDGTNRGACPCGYVETNADYFVRNEGGLVGGPPNLGGTRAGRFAVDGPRSYEGTSVWLLDYEFRTPSIEGPFTVRRREWIEVNSYRLLRREERNDDRFGSRDLLISTLHDFDRVLAPLCS